MTNYIERYWRDAKPEDAIKVPPMTCRMRLDESEDWYDAGHLMGCDRSSDEKWITEGWQDRQCQVYDAPDPGEGWRLIDIENEKPEPTDEYLRDGKYWIEKGNPCDFVSYQYYRRRTTPAVTYLPFTWEDREQLRGRWIVQVESTGTEQMVNKLDLINDDLFANNKLALELLTGWSFLDTGEPVGKKVTQ